MEQPTKNIWLSGLLGGALAFVGVLILFIIARLFGVSLQVGAPPDWTSLVSLPATQLFFATIIPAVVATLLYAVLRLIFKQSAARVFQVIALILLLLSLGGPLSLAVNPVNKIILALMHVVTALSIIWALTLRK
jgi:hypothetical protein